MKRKTPKVLLIGWDAADWKVIHPLIDAGKMPALERLINQGVMANLATLHPVLSPMLWTSIATGMRPFNHGVLGFTEPSEDGTGIRPVSSLTRKVKAIWNILNQNGKRSNVVGWWPSHPAEPINGVMISNHYHHAGGPIDKPWPLPPGTVYPPRLIPTLAELRFHPNELLGDDILPFIPDGPTIDQEKDRRLASCAKILAECTSVHSAATWLMENEPWDLMAVYYDAIDHFCHGFMRYHPPRQDFIREADFELYKGVVEAGYRYHDMMLYRLLSLAGEDTTVILVSDHGFHPDHLRPRAIPNEPAGPAVEHRDFGIFVMKGPGVRQDEVIYGANLLDITPTILTVFGLPVGEDMDGKPLVEAFESPPDIETIPSWEAVQGKSGQYPSGAFLDPLESQEAINQLIALGYIEKPDENKEKAIAGTVRELRYNLARSYMDAALHSQAVPILKELYEDDRQEYRFGIQLAMCYRALGKIPLLRALVEEMSARRTEDAREAKVKLEEMREMIRRRRQERESQKDGKQAEEAGEEEKPEDEANRLLSDEERAQMRRLIGLANISTSGLDYLMGFVLAAEGNHEEALTYLKRAEKAEGHRPGLYLQIGEVYLKMKRWEDAEGAFRKAAEIDPENPHAHLGFARSFLPRRKNRLAAEEALQAVALLYHYPLAHYCLGIALHRLGKVLKAAQALKVAVSLNPNFREAHLRLAMIYERRLKDPLTAAEHRRLAEETRKKRKGESVEAAETSSTTGDPLPSETEANPHPVLPGPRVNPEEVVIIVSGLPRSGTSMMMRMLEAAGVEILSDGIRKADEDNPLGYYEFEPVKRTRQDPSWLNGAGGKAVKMVHMLLPELPNDRYYRVIMMRRNPEEVIASQRKMLDRQGKQGANLSPEAMKREFARQMQRVKRHMDMRPCFQVMDMDYNRLLKDPAKQIEKLIAWLGLSCPVESLFSVIDPSLYRSRTKK